jgi:hypothetical protein
MKTAYRVLFVQMFAVLFLAGCINYEQKTTLKGDGSGEMEIHYWTKESNITWLSDSTLVFKEEDVKQQYSGEGVKIVSNTVSTDNKDSTRHVKLTIKFDDINKLNATKGFKGSTFSFKKDGKNCVFKHDLKAKSNAGGFGMEEYSVTYTYTVSGDVVSSNATQVNGKELVWKYKLNELSKDVSMNVTFAGGGGGMMTLLIILIIVVVVVVVIIIIAKGRKKAPPIISPLPPSPEPPSPDPPPAV